MKKSQVKLGGVYSAKVTNRVVQVRIDAESRYGGWDGTNIQTGKKVRIHSAQRLRATVGRDTSPTVAKKGRATKKAKTPAAAKHAQTSTPKGEDRAVVTTTVGKIQRTRAKKAKADKRMSGLDAAAKVLEESKQPMTAKEMVEVAAAKGYWKSPGGKTPHATVFSAIIREIAKKGEAARFVKTERGKFTAKR